MINSKEFRELAFLTLGIYFNLSPEVSLRTADAFPVVASLPPKKRRPEMRLQFAGITQFI